MKRWKGNLTRWLAALLFAAMLNTGGLYTGLALAANRNLTPHEGFDSGREVPNADDQITVSYGVDPDKVPYALKGDGTKARYVSLSPVDFKVQFTKEVYLGEVEFRRLPGRETLTAFKPASGEPLLVRTIISSQLSGDRAPDFNLVFQLNGSSAAIEVNQNSRQATASRDAERRVQNVLAGAQANPALVSLMREAKFFLGKPVMTKLAPRAIQLESDCIKVDPFDCTKEVIFCLGTIASYIAAVGGLILVCPETIGAGCIGAMLAHPVLAAVVAVQCVAAINACGYGTGTKKPCPNEIELDIELIQP